MEVSLSESITASPRLKVKRAHCHIDELRRLTDPLDRSLYEITISKVRRYVIDLHPTMYQLAYRPKQPIPEMLALVIGDAIHNLRTALDHLATGILRAFPVPNSPVDPNFPMAPERKHIKTNPVLTAIEKAIPGSKKLFLEKIRPDNGRDERLWRFNSLDNLDKHNLIIPTVTVVTVDNINARFGGTMMSNCAMGGDAAGEMKMILSAAPIAIDHGFQTAVDVKFGKGTAFEDEPVVPTLTQISDLVSKTVKEFGALITAHEASVGLQTRTIGPVSG